MRKTTSERKGDGATLDREPADREIYEEYVRGFDEIPVLSDVVRTPPQRVRQPNFVRGERRDLRRAERADGYSAREEGLAEIEGHYREYSAVGPLPARSKRKKARKATTTKRPRARTRKRAAAGA